MTATIERRMATIRRKAEFKSKMPSMARRLSMRQIQLRDTKSRAELLVKDSLDEIGIRYIFQKGFMCKGDAVRLVDFMLPGNAMFLEIDGPEHNQEKDSFRELQIKKSAPGYSFLRIKNSDVYENEINLTEYLWFRMKSHWESMPGWQQRMTNSTSVFTRAVMPRRKIGSESSSDQRQTKIALERCQGRNSGKASVKSCAEADARQVQTGSLERVSRLTEQGSPRL